jgi:ribonuclease MRP protein subunit RMP1
VCRAFSNLVADNQYAALGLMLLATLARMNRVISPLALKAIVTEPVLKEGLVASSAPDGDVVAREDFGERIERGAPTSTKEGNITPKSDNKAAKKRGFATEETAMNKQVQASATPKPPKKKRKKGDAFDDLFSGLM